MPNSYITLATSSGSINKRFWVSRSQYNERLDKVVNIERTIGGKLDVTFGSVIDVREYDIRVRFTETDPLYGDVVDLKALFELNEPSGTPSSILKFKDHYYPENNTEHDVVITGSFNKSIFGFALDGEGAWFTIRIVLYILE